MPAKKYFTKEEKLDARRESGRKNAARIRATETPEEREARLQYFRDWRKANPGYRPPSWNETHRSRKYRLKRQYGISEDAYITMLESQNGRCAICHGQPERHAHLSVDHNHATGKVRGLLCESCNFLLGKAKDSIEILLTAVEYLKENDG